MKQRDKDVLRALGSEIAKLSALPVQAETISLWKALNGLRPRRPLVTIDQIPWHEMEVDGELTLSTEDPSCRRLETELRRTLYLWKHMRVDMVIEPEFVVSKVIRDTGYGVHSVEHTKATDPNNDVVGHSYDDQLKTDEDIAKIRTPDVSLDREATERAEATAREAFEGIMPVRMQGATPSCAPWDVITQWHGVEPTLVDIMERPEFMHRMADRLTTAFLGMLDALEAKGLLGHHMSLIHCTGAFTDELPAPGFEPARPRAKDLWNFGMAQIFGSVSPAMHEEFELPYMQRIYARFGLGYYGCCEPLSDRIAMVRKIPNVRKISMSPWTNQEKGAQGIGRDYVFSRKPNPALLAMDTFSPDVIEKDLGATIAVCKENGCPLEIIMKDISTVRYEPKRLWQWAAIAKRLVETA
jgi:hypothetical protein